MRFGGLLAITLLALGSPALAASEMVILANETTDTLTLSINGAPPCSASPGSGCMRSAANGANTLEACSQKRCIKIEVTIEDREIVQFTVDERPRNPGYQHAVEKRKLRF